MTVLDFLESSGRCDMLRHFIKKWQAGLFLVICFILATGTASTFAQESTPERDTTCIECHQEQYTLYDHGKWYCLCKSPVRCTDCHGGQVDTMNKDLAHEGLQTKPLAGDEAVCQECHPDDYQEHITKFAQIAGVHEVHQPDVTCTPPALTSQAADTGTSTGVLRTLPPGIWQVMGVGFLGMAALGVFIFFCRCWKFDHPG
jgi:hypothetical protein